MAPREHELKCWPEPFGQLASGIKTAEFRLDDRGFRAGDSLLLREWSPFSEKYSGRCLYALVTCKTTEFGIPAGYAMLSLKVGPVQAALKVA